MELQYHYDEGKRLFDRRVQKAEGRAQYLARLEARLYELAADLNMADWKALRNSEYWQQKTRIEAWQAARVEIEIATASLLGSAIRRYMEEQKTSR